jgi:hypothetical protein
VKRDNAPVVAQNFQRFREMPLKPMFAEFLAKAGL